MREAIARIVRRLHGPIDGLNRLFEHLQGRNRIDFRRLFMATSTGNRCWEMERFGFRPKKPLLEDANEPNGYWLPAWTWNIVRDALRRDHLYSVMRGEESRVETAHRPSPSETLRPDERTPAFVLALLEDAVMKAMIRDRERRL